MIKAISFALLFVVLGAIAFAFLAPLLFHGADMRRLGAIMFPLIVLVCGTGGFAFGWRRRKKVD